MIDTVKTNSSLGSENDPLRFYIRKKEVVVEASSLNYFWPTIFGLLALFILVGSICGYHFFHDAGTGSTKTSGSFLTSMFSSSADGVPQFKSKDQKARLSAAIVMSIGGDSLIVVNKGRQTRVAFDSNLDVSRKGETFSLAKFQEVTDDYLTKVQFGSSPLYIPPDAFAHVPGTLKDLKVGSIVNIIPSRDSPDGDEAKAASILILR